MGYHTKEIKKGVYGEFSKVEEEWEELLDARSQDGKILELCELADLYGAIDGYVKAKFNLTIEDVSKMSRMTSSAFEEGTRKPTTTLVVNFGPSSYVDATSPSENDRSQCYECHLGTSARIREPGGAPYCDYCWAGTAWRPTSS